MSDIPDLDRSAEGTVTGYDPLSMLDEGTLVHKAIALALAVFTMYVALTARLNVFQQLGTFLLLTLIYLFVRFPLVDTLDVPVRGRLRYVFHGIDALFILSSIGAYGYLIVNSVDVLETAGTATDLQVFLGFVGLFMVLEATRRTVGIAIPFLASFSLFYVYFGDIFPGVFHHPGFSSRRLIIQMFLTGRGLFSFPLAVMLDFVYLFVLFGALLEFSGGGQFFLDLSKSLFGKVTGGPAKLAVVSSGFMGMLSGSVTANVLTTGAFTIPTMKEQGYGNEFAGGVESAASTGGQLMPPVMGAAVFVMVELTGIDYLFIIVHALVPALLYFFTVYMIIHFQSIKEGLLGLPEDQIPAFRTVLTRMWYFVPVISIIYLLYQGFSIQGSIIYSLALLIGLTTVSSKARLFDPRRESDTLLSNPMLNSIETTAKRAAPIVVAATSIGIVLGSVGLTGTGLKLSSLILDMAGNSLFIALVLTMILSIIFGMAMDTVTVYILLAVLVAPGLVNAGVMEFSSHLYIFYFGMMAMVTPPVCLAAYAAATIAESDPLVTGVWASRLSIAAYLLPFAFVYNPALLMIGEPVDIVIAVGAAAVGLTALAAANVGHAYIDLNAIERILLLVAAVLLIFVGELTDAIGLALIAVVLFNHYDLLLDRYRVLTGKS